MKRSSLHKSFIRLLPGLFGLALTVADETFLWDFYRFFYELLTTIITTRERYHERDEHVLSHLFSVKVHRLKFSS